MFSSHHSSKSAIVWTEKTRENVVKAVSTKLLLTLSVPFAYFTFLSYSPATFSLDNVVLRAFS